MCCELSRTVRIDRIAEQGLKIHNNINSRHAWRGWDVWPSIAFDAQETGESTCTSEMSGGLMAIIRLKAC